MKQIILIFILIAGNSSFACINGASKLLKDGTYLFEVSEGNVPYGYDFNTENFKSGIHRLDSLYKTTKDIDYLSDKGLLLILVREYEKAIKLYLEIEKTNPGRYATASNIGTAYELTGQNENALKWIKKAVHIDPESHSGSEWIHVKILEAKIKGPEFYTSNFLLNTDFGTDTLPRSTLTKKELLTLSYALYYQLNERVSFVKPKEKIVAQLLFDLGNIAFLLENFSDAGADYEEAKKYGYSGAIFSARIKEVEKKLKTKAYTKAYIEQLENNQDNKDPEELNDDGKKKTHNKHFLPGTLTGLTIILIIIFARRNRKKNKQ